MLWLFHKERKKTRELEEKKAKKLRTGVTKARRNLQELAEMERKRFEKEVGKKLVRNMSKKNNLRAEFMKEMKELKLRYEPTQN